MFEFEPSVVAGFRHTVRGDVIAPGDSDYAFARRVYNAMIDRLPSLIVRCTDISDVERAVRFGAEQDVALAVQAALLKQHAPDFGFDAFCTSRLGADWGQTFGTLASSTDFDSILQRAMPR